MQQRYTLPVSAILQTLRDQHNGMTALSARLPAGRRTGHADSRTRLRPDLYDSIPHGLLLVQGGEALKALEQLGKLEWQVQGFRGRGETPSLEHSTGSDPACSPEHLTDQSIPRRRVAALSPEQQQTFSRRHRQVFALSDGTRSVASIAILLHLSSEEVAHLLHELHQDQLLD